MDANRFNNILARAQGLMLDEGFNRKVDGIASTFANRNGNGGSGADLQMFERMAFGDVSGSDGGITLLEGSNSGGGINMDKLNKLPEAMRESFMKNPPMSGDGNDNTPLGVATKILSENVRGAVRQPQPVQQPVQGIDYSLIKSLIDESVSRNLREMLGNGGMLNESSEPRMVGMAIRGGNRLQFMDSKGNLYEAVLKLKKKTGQ